MEPRLPAMLLDTGASSFTLVTSYRYLLVY